MKDQGWSVGFFTLTYDDRHLPIVPRCLWTDESKFEPLCAFSKSDIREFITRLRKHLQKVYRIEQLKFMICSELGSTTQRSHYHGVICWPENGHTYYTERMFKGEVIKKEWRSKPCSDFELHKAICDIWDKGFVRPRYASGGMDSHGHDHKPFRVDGDFQFCCRYAGKYCVKDMYYLEYLQRENAQGEKYTDFIDVKSKLFKAICMPFHMQSKSLGASILGEFTTAEQKLNLLANGYQFLGSDKFLRIPVYIRNKLVFDIDYQIDDDGKRLVRRQANQFFRENAEQIFEMKAKYYTDTFKSLVSPGYLEGRGVDADNAYYVSGVIQDFLSAYGTNVENLARYYLAWYGVDPHYCYDVEPYNQWLGRYILNEQIHADGLPLVDRSFLDDLSYTCSCIMFGLGLIPCTKSYELPDKVRDFHKSEVG